MNILRAKEKFINNVLNKKRTKHLEKLRQENKEIIKLSNKYIKDIYPNLIN